VKYEKAIGNMTLLAASYDPVSQTSSHSMFAGTEATYRRTGVFGDDREMDDT
jgi:hypothetical protein